MAVNPKTLGIIVLLPSNLVLSKRSLNLVPHRYISKTPDLHVRGKQFTPICHYFHYIYDGSDYFMMVMDLRNDKHLYVIAHL